MGVTQSDEGLLALVSIIPKNEDLGLSSTMHLVSCSFLAGMCCDSDLLDCTPNLALSQSIVRIHESHHLLVCQRGHTDFQRDWAEFLAIFCADSSVTAEVHALIS